MNLNNFSTGAIKPLCVAYDSDVTTGFTLFRTDVAPNC